MDAYLAAWRDIERVSGRAFNLGGGPDNAVSLRQLIARIEALAGHGVGRWRSATGATGDQRYFVADARAPACDARPARRRSVGAQGVADLAAWLKVQSEPAKALAMPAAVAV